MYKVHIQLEGTLEWKETLLYRKSFANSTSKTNNENDFLSKTGSRSLKRSINGGQIACARSHSNSFIVKIVYVH